MVRIGSVRCSVLGGKKIHHLLLPLLPVFYFIVEAVLHIKAA